MVRKLTCGDCAFVFPKPKGQPNPYNLYFKRRVQDPLIQALPVKERMAAVGALWKVEKASQPPAPPRVAAAKEVACPKCDEMVPVRQPRKKKKVKLETKLPEGAVEAGKQKKKKKAKRNSAPSAWNLFFKANASSAEFKSTPPKEKMKLIAQKWNLQKKSAPVAAAAAVPVGDAGLPPAVQEILAKRRAAAAAQAP